MRKRKRENVRAAIRARAGPPASPPRWPAVPFGFRVRHADFASALRAALPTDPTLGPIVAAASVAAGTVDEDGTPCGPDSPPRRSFVCRDGLLYLRSPRGGRLCIPEAAGLHLQVLQELHPTPLAGHFGRDKTLALARRSVRWPGLSAAVGEYIRTCPTRTCQLVKADHLPPACLPFPLPVPTRRGGHQSRLHRAPAGPVGPRLCAGAHRLADGPSMAGPDQEDRHG